MRCISGNNRSTMLFYYNHAHTKLVEWTRSTTYEDDTGVVLYCQAIPRPSPLTEYTYSERTPHCPTCMHDTSQSPFCGGAECETIRREVEIEQGWYAIADGSETSDGEAGLIDDSDDFAW